MRNLDKNIQELLYRYDCVIIPEFGGFVTNYKGARIDSLRDIIYPPCKDISFNKNLLKNDGLLASSIAGNHNISFEEANAIIKETVEGYFATLNNGKRITFEKVGILYFDRNHKLHFSADNSVNYLMDSYGFEALYSPALKEEQAIKTETLFEKQALKVSVDFAPTQKPADKKVAADKEEIRKLPLEKSTETRNNKRILYRVAAAIALPLLAYTAFLAFNGNFENPKELSIADLNPFKQKVTLLYSPAPYDVTPIEVLNKDSIPENGLWNYNIFTGKVDDVGGIPVNFNAIILPGNNNSAKHTRTPGPYHIIAGCFAEEENAIKLVKKYEGFEFEPAILDFHKGLYRVKIKSFSDYHLALNELKMLKNGQIPAAWMLKKPNL